MKYIQIIEKYNTYIYNGNILFESRNKKTKEKQPTKKCHRKNKTNCVLLIFY